MALFTFLLSKLGKRLPDWPETGQRLSLLGKSRLDQKFEAWENKRLRRLEDPIAEFGEVQRVTRKALTSSGAALGDVTVALGGEKDFYLGAAKDQASTFFAVVAFPIRSREQGRAALDLLLKEPALAPILATAR